MAIHIQETFQIAAPIDEVWRFVMDPEKVVTCMPGAELQEMVDDHTFVGTVKVKVGAITASYRGRVYIAHVDEKDHRLELLAEGRDTGGGTAKGTMSASVRSLPDGGTEVVTVATVDLTGRIMQVGRGMIQGVSNQLFQQFVASTKQRLETPTGEPSAAVPETRQEAIRLVPLILRVIWAAICRFFRRLFGRPEA